MMENRNYSESSPVFGEENSKSQMSVFAILNIKWNSLIKTFECFILQKQRKKFAI